MPRGFAKSGINTGWFNRGYRLTPTKEKIKKICPVCKKEFSVYPSGLHRKTCSRKCASILRKPKVSGKNHWLWKGGLIDRQCSYCGKTYKILPYRKDISRFCSHKCLFDSRKIRTIKKCPNCKEDFEIAVHILRRNKKWIFCSKNCFLDYTNGRIYLICKNCGKKYWTYKSHKKWRGSSFCSNKCKVEYYREENHPAWKGGPEAQNRRDVSSYKYIQWRKKVFKRDNWICQKCGNRSSKGNPVELRSHHIKSWKKYPKLRFVVSNGQTLCNDCHYKVHSKRITDKEAELYEAFLRKLKEK